MGFYCKYGTLLFPGGSVLYLTVSALCSCVQSKESLPGGRTTTTKAQKTDLGIKYFVLVCSFAFHCLLPELMIIDVLVLMEKYFCLMSLTLDF